MNTGEKEDRQKEEKKGEKISIITPNEEQAEEMAGKAFHYDRKKHQVEKAKHKIDRFLMDKKDVFITSQK